MKIIICNYNFEETLSSDIEGFYLSSSLRVQRISLFPLWTCPVFDPRRADAVQRMLGNVGGYMPRVLELLCDQILIFSLTQKNPLIFQINANNLKWWIIAPYQNSITVKHWRIADWKLWIISCDRERRPEWGNVRTKDGCHKAHCQCRYFITYVSASHPAI